MEYLEIIKSIGFKIKVLRMKNNLTQSQLAALIDANEKYIGKVESGKQNITIRTLSKILIALNIEFEDFINMKL